MIVRSSIISVVLMCLSFGALAQSGSTQPPPQIITGKIVFSGAVVVGTQPDFDDASQADLNAVEFSNPSFAARKKKDTPAEVFFSQSQLPNAQSFRNFIATRQGLKEGEPLQGTVRTWTYL